MTVVSFRAPRDEGKRITKTMKRIALDNDEPVMDTYLRALSDFVVRQVDHGALWQSMKRIAQAKDEPVWETYTRALREFVERQGSMDDEIESE